MSHTRMTTLPFLLLALSRFVMSDSDYPLVWCPLCKLKTLWDIFMILGRNVEQDQIGAVGTFVVFFFLETFSNFFNFTFGLLADKKAFRHLEMVNPQSIL